MKVPAEVVGRSTGRRTAPGSRSRIVEEAEARLEFDMGRPSDCIQKAVQRLLVGMAVPAYKGLQLAAVLRAGGKMDKKPRVTSTTGRFDAFDELKPQQSNEVKWAVTAKLYKHVGMKLP